MPVRRRLSLRDSLLPQLPSVRELARAGAGLPIERFRRWEHELVPVDVFERDGTIVVRAEMPGIALEDIDVAVVDGDLRISGEREDDPHIKDEQYYRRERASGRIHRTIELPDGCRLDAIQANLKAGVLEVSVPTDRSASTRRIEVQRTE
jgi:HSP20 family protein